MKKIVSLLIVLLLIVSMVPCVHAAGSAYMSGPDTVRAGDTITVSFVAGGGILGGNGSVSYDPALLTLQGYSQTIGGSWAVEFSGNNFVFYDNNQENPINGSATIFKAIFLVSSAVTEGTTISVSATGVTLSDGKADTAIGTCTYSTQIAPPLSANCDLGELTVSNATISPAFAADTTYYTASVPFSTSSLDVSATAADSKATITVGSTQLVAGGTTSVRITVVAENGSTKEYVISVTRAQDPNYVKSSDATLKSLAVEGCTLSPAFSADVTQYYVWLPYEVESVTLKAEAAHALASATIGDHSTLVPAQGNRVAITVTAEDGTQLVYTVTVFRAPAHEDTEAFLSGEREPVEEPTTEPTEEPTTAPTEPPTAEPTTEPVTQPTEPDAPAPDNRPIILIATGVICLVIGIIIGFLIWVLIGKKRDE